MRIQKRLRTGYPCVIFFCIVIILFSFNFLHFHCTNLKRQTEQIDESVCIMVIVQFSCCEACKGFTVQRIWRSSSGFDDVTFVKLEFHFSCYIFLCTLDKCLNCFTQWCEPFSLIYDLGQLVAHFFLNFISSTV